MNKNHFLLSSVRRNLKNILLVCGVFFLLGFLLMHPAESLVCAKAGMTLWLNTLIPTLLPFIILTGILTRIDNIQKILSPLESYFRVLLGVSSWGGYVFLLGMLCGYPLGAKLASDLYTAEMNFNNFMNSVFNIITATLAGEDPAEQGGGCSPSSCASCGGCH